MWSETRSQSSCFSRKSHFSSKSTISYDFWAFSGFTFQNYRDRFSQTIAQKLRLTNFLAQTITKSTYYYAYFDMSMFHCVIYDVLHVLHITLVSKDPKSHDFCVYKHTVSVMWSVTSWYQGIRCPLVICVVKAWLSLPSLCVLLVLTAISPVFTETWHWFLGFLFLRQLFLDKVSLVSN